MQKLGAFLIAALFCSCSHSESAPKPQINAEHISLKWKNSAGLREGIIDSHVHLSPTLPSVNQAIRVLKAAGISKIVHKSAGVPGSRMYLGNLQLREIIEKEFGPDSIRLFSNLDWHGIDDPNFVAREVERLHQAKSDGIRGVKVYKALGLSVRTKDGKLLKADAPLLDPIFEACADLDLIFAWHIADPVAFFEPVTPANERYAELSIAESWSFFGKDYPTFQELMDAQENVIKRHPRTTFLLIHFGNNSEDLDYVDRLLDTYPNVYIDTSARVPEIGRHNAEKVRAFFIKHQDRILFGSDLIFGPRGHMQLGSVSEKEPDFDDAIEFYERHWRFFETGLRQIEHPTPIQGNWRIDAIDLPEEVLQKIYITNAEQLIFKQQSPAPTQSAH